MYWQRSRCCYSSVQAFISISTINNFKLLSERVSRKVTSNSLGCLRLSKFLGCSVFGELANSSKDIDSKSPSHGESITKVVTNVCPIYSAFCGNLIANHSPITDFVRTRCQTSVIVFLLAIYCTITK